MLTAIALPKNFNMSFKQKIWLSNTEVAPGEYFKYNLDLKAKTCEKMSLDKSSSEFPTINPDYHCL